MHRAKQTEDYDDFDQPRKILVLGAPGVGKTSLIHSFVFDRYPPIEEEIAWNGEYSVKFARIKKDVKCDLIIQEYHPKVTEIEGEDGELQFTLDHSLLAEFDCFIVMVVRGDINSLRVAEMFGHEMVETHSNHRIDNKNHPKQSPHKTRCVILMENKYDLCSEDCRYQRFHDLKRRFPWTSQFSFTAGIAGCDCITECSMIDGGVDVKRVIPKVVLGWQKNAKAMKDSQEMKMYKEEVNKNTLVDCCNHDSVSFMYDMITLLVSLADILTDLWVLIQWYNQGRMVPFGISVSILISAQFSYVTGFIVKFVMNSSWSLECCPGRGEKNFWWLLPLLFLISPVLSFIMYFGCIENSFMNGLLIQYLQFKVRKHRPSKNDTKIERFLKEKLHKHMGFLLEAAVEAFPQSILQMAVMVYYSETNWISVASILLSLISVCTKSLVFSYALELRTMIFNYLSIVLDFISVFALITWVFYNPNQSGLTTLGWIWVYKVLFTTVPSVFIFGFMFTVDEANLYTSSIQVCLIYLLWLFSIPFVSLISEIMCCSLLSFFIHQGYCSRFAGAQATGIFWSHTLSFVNAGPTWEDRKLRVILVMESLRSHRGFVGDSTLSERIEQSRQVMYKDLSWKDLRTSISDTSHSTPYSQLMAKHREFQDVQKDRLLKLRHNVGFGCNSTMVGLVGSFFLIYFALPVHLMTRLFNVSYVWISLVMREWNEIDHLQLGMACLLGVLQLMWLLSFVMQMRSHFATWHIYPSKQLSLNIQNADQALVKVKQIDDLHSAYIMEPLRKQAVIQHFGIDIGSVVLEYLPTRLVDLGGKK